MNIKKLMMMVMVLNYLRPSWHWNDRSLYAFIIKFLPMFQSQEIVWFLSESMVTEHTQELDGFMKRLIGNSLLSQFVWTNRSDIRITKIVSKRTSMSIVFTTGATDPIMHVHNRVLTGRHFGITIVVYVAKVSNLTIIEDICYKLYQGSFVNSLVNFEDLDGFNHLYSPVRYPSFHVENRTDYEAYIRRKYRSDLTASQDVHGYTYYAPFRQDLPKVIKYQDKYGTEQLHGVTYQLLATFIESINGSLREYKMPKDVEDNKESLNMTHILDLVRSRKIDMAAHAYALYQTDDDLDKSFPIMVVKWCLMVPLRNSISTKLYPVQPFENLVWLLLLLVQVLICCLGLVTSLWDSHIKHKSGNFFATLSDAWLNAISLVFNIAAGKPMYLTSWKQFIVLSHIFFFGFFLSANYTSYLGSVLTVNLFRAQINSIEDIIYAQLPVMVVDYELEFLLAEGYQMPQGFHELLRPVDTTTFAQHQFQLNTSYAYFVTEDTWSFLDKTQRHLKQRIFKFSNICFGSYHLAYPIQKDSAVWRDLEYFLFHCHSNGLIQQYEKTAFQAAVSAGYIRRLIENSEYTSAGWSHLVMVFSVMGFTYVMGAISLIIELVVYRFEKKILKI